VADWYDAYPESTVSNSDYGTKYRVLRGGSWFNLISNVRSAFRYRFTPDDSLYYRIGFRCAKDAP